MRGKKAKEFRKFVARLAQLSNLTKDELIEHESTKFIRSDKNEEVRSIQVKYSNPSPRRSYQDAKRDSKIYGAPFAVVNLLEKYFNPNEEKQVQATV